jgi:hypothetical protein
MTEIIFVLVATVFAFALFLLVFFIKGSSDSDDAQMPTCAPCACHRSRGQLKRSLRYLKQIEKDIRP